MEEKKAFKVVITDNETGAELISEEANCIIGSIGNHAVVVIRGDRLEIVDAVLVANKAIKKVTSKDEMIEGLANFISKNEDKFRGEDE